MNSSISDFRVVKSGPTTEELITALSQGEKTKPISFSLIGEGAFDCLILGVSIAGRDVNTGRDNFLADGRLSWDIEPNHDNIWFIRGRIIGRAGVFGNDAKPGTRFEGVYDSDKQEGYLRNCS